MMRRFIYLYGICESDRDDDDDDRGGHDHAQGCLLSSCCLDLGLRC